MKSRDKKQERPRESSTGFDVSPKPNPVARVSRRAAAAAFLVLLFLLAAVGYGGHKRSKQIQATAVAAAGSVINLAPATEAGNEVIKNIPAGNASVVGHPDADPASASEVASEPAGANQTDPCDSNPLASRVARYDSSRQPCAGDSDAVSDKFHGNAPLFSSDPPQRSEVIKQDDPAALASQREREAMLATTAVRNDNSQAVAISPFDKGAASPPSVEPAQLTALRQALGPLASSPSGAPPMLSTSAPTGLTDYDSQNMQSRKDLFLAQAKTKNHETYLLSTRTAQLSKFEIKAGWEIPAVLLQAVNSDLPGDLKALVTSNVFDTATGMFLLIPQGSLLVGKYDSHVSYGQEGLQVIWNRVIFPDGSSLDLGGMIGMDAHGNAGFRDKVDRHYKRIIGMTLLSTVFAAAVGASQRTNITPLSAPTATQAASAGAAQQVTDLGSQVTHRNINVQNTLRIPVGYKFMVSVDRDILFEGPYRPQPEDPQELPSKKLTRQMSLSAIGEPNR